jgi:hypothetical protein
VPTGHSDPTEGAPRPRSRITRIGGRALTVSGLRDLFTLLLALGAGIYGLIHWVEDSGDGQYFSQSDGQHLKDAVVELKQELNDQVKTATVTGVETAKILGSVEAKLGLLLQERSRSRANSGGN